MYECDHQLVEIVYGYMHSHMIGQLDNHDVMYGGMRKEPGMAEWFCIKCLEEI